MFVSSAESRIAVLDVRPRLLSDALALALASRGWNVVDDDLDIEPDLTIFTTDGDLVPSVFVTGPNLAVRISTVSDLEVVLSRLTD